MNFEELIAQLKNPEKTRNFNFFYNYSLDTFSAVTTTLVPDRDRNDLIRVSVVGTNGKGSTSHYLSQLALSSTEFSTVGLYTSPHLLSYLERIQINHRNISIDVLNKLLAQIIQKNNLYHLLKLSFFELLTLFSFLCFDKYHCDLEIYEAGLGGRLDATKLSKPDYVILTSIQLDHTEILGKTREQIVIEKLHIISEDTKALFHAIHLDDPIYPLIKQFCKENSVQEVPFVFDRKKTYLENNRSLALCCLNRILTDKNKKPFADTNVLPAPKGRMEIIRNNPLLIFDIAHNPAAMEELFCSIQQRYVDKKWVLYFAILKDKDIDGIVAILERTDILKRIYKVIGASFSDTLIGSSKITEIELLKFRENIRIITEDALVIGSFQMYQYVCHFKS
jgi:dihydrofolate synthase / folylpolyglutamate synthase